ncbi:MAG: thioredoxin family protein [Patescibacteria group bacterium]
MKNNSQKGFAMPVLIAIVALVVVVAGVGYYATRVQPQTAQLPASEKTLEDGTVVKADGTMVKPDGTMVKPDGTMVKPDGTMIKPDGTMVKPDGTTEKDKSTMEKAPEGSMMSKGSYEVYGPEKLARASDGDVVLFFREPWCPTCRGLDADIRAHLDQIPAGVTILDVDYDKSTALKQKYGVTYQHTLVQVDAEGNTIAKWNKSATLASILGNIK